MTIRDPLIIDSGLVKQLPDGDILKLPPESTTFGYTGDNLTTVTTASGTKTLTYNGSDLATITDTIAGTLSTFNYSGGRLVSITVTSL